MIEFFKTASGSINYVLIVSVFAWVVSTFGIVASIHKHRSDTLAAQESARNSLAQKEEEGRLRKDAEDRLKAAEAKIVELQPKPFKTRLWSFFDSVDPAIRRGFDGGARTFEGSLTASQYSSLQKLVGEPEAKEALRMEVMGGLFGGGPDGSLHGVMIHVSDNISEK